MHQGAKTGKDTKSGGAAGGKRGDKEGEGRGKDGCAGGKDGGQRGVKEGEGPKEAAQAAKTAAKAAAQAAKTAAEKEKAAKRARRECTDDERRQYVEALVEKHRKLYAAMHNASADPRLPVADLENEDICIEVVDKDGAKDYTIFASLTLDPELVCLEISPIYRRNIVELLTMSLGADGFFRCRVVGANGIDFWLRVSARALRRWPAGLAVTAGKDCSMCKAAMALDL